MTETFPTIIMRRVVLPIIGLALASSCAGCMAIMVAMPGSAYQGPLAPLDDRELELRDGLKTHVAKLAGEIGARSVDRGLDRADAYLVATFTKLGYTPKRETYTFSGIEVANIIAELPGSEAGIVLVGAHYDAIHGRPGADDNASGVAALLELARILKLMKLEQTIRFVAFANEEPPYFQTERMGSLINAKRARERGDRITAMISLESIGYYSDKPGSQKYPVPVHWFYPDRGDFIGFVGDFGSRPLVHRALVAFREHARFPAYAVAAPAMIPGVGWSDQWSFWQYDYPGVMVTDTALFRNPNYHRSSDRPETLDYDRMARVVHGMAAVIRTLAHVGRSAEH